MGKLVLFLSLLSLFILIAGSLFMPNDPTMWLAGTSTAFIWLRVLVCAALITLLVTNPPRNIVLRYVIGLFSYILVMSAVVLTFQSRIKLLDSLSLAAAGTSMAIVCLEVNYEADSRKKPVFANHKTQPKLKIQAAH